MKARQFLNKSTVWMLHYNDLVSHVVLQSLCQLFVASRNFPLCKSSWLWRGRQKSLLGHDIKVEMEKYLKEKLRS